MVNEAPSSPIDRERRSKLRALLMEGLGVRKGRQLVDVKYSKDGRRLTAKFADEAADMGCLLVGSDGPPFSVQILLVGAEKFKIT